MIKISHTYSLIFFFLFTLLSFGQSNNDKTNKDEASFTVRGSVYLKDTREPIDNVSIQINNGKYTRTDIFGKFVVKARVGDELTIKDQK